MDAATSLSIGNAGLHNEGESIASFVTLDILQEELAVIEHCIKTTPDTPFTINRRNGLVQEKQKLLQMMAQITMPPQEDDSNNREERNSSADESASTSSSPSPAPSNRLALPLDRLKREEGSVSGFSTPRSIKEDPFASAVEEPFAQHDDYNADRIAQEIADWEFAQQIAQQINGVDEFDDGTLQLAELERQRQAQIEADEEFARQIQAAMSPVHHSSSGLQQQQQHRSQDLDFTSPMDNVKMESDIDTPPLQTLSPQLIQRGFSSTSSSSHIRDSSGNSSPRQCQKCAQEHGPDDTVCWRCLGPLTTTPTPPTPPENFPTLTPLEIQQMHYAKQIPAQQTLERQQARIRQAQLAQHQQLLLQQRAQAALQQQQNPGQQISAEFWAPVKPEPNQDQHIPAEFWAKLGSEFRQAQPLFTNPYQQQRQAQQNYSAILQHAGTSSNPISLDDSPPHLQKPFQTSTFIPPVPSVPTPALLNNGWGVGYQQPVPRPSSQGAAASQPGYMYPSYDWNVPGPSTEEIKDLLSNIRPDEDIKVEDKDAIIEGMAPQMRLMKHQQMGLAWMQKMEDSKNKGGLLADEMGLGKTIQSIALLVSRPSNDDKCKTTLICCPVALLQQWYNEIRTKTHPPLRVYIHHSSSRGKKAKSSEDLLKYDVVLTTYNTISYEWKAWDKYEHSEDLNIPKPSTLFLDAKWYRIILDESQVIKNRITQVAKGVCILKSTFRWSLSGTPMQNGVEEIYSQLAFLRIRPYNEWKQFHSTFVVGFKKGSKRTDAMRKFQALLKAILLRRTKTSKIDGVEILKGLPGKTIEMVHTVFGDEQDEFYKALEAGTIAQIKKYRAAGTLGRNYHHALVMLLRLRQACLHPRLIKEIKKAGSTELTGDEQIKLARKFAEQVVVRIKEIPSFECPVCLETVLNPSLVLPCGHHYCTECLASMFDQEREDAMARGEDYKDKAKCPECRGEVDARRLVSLESFKAAHCREVEEDDVDSYDGSASEAEEDDEWLFAEDRKRKGKGKEPANKKPRKKVKPVEDEEMEDWESSAKIDKLCEILEAVRANDPTDKVIVFSQFTGFLDIIQPALLARNFSFGRYDGSMGARQRVEELENFRSDPLKTVCLVSLRAGAYGLNLTCASQCVILDPFWNPFVEDQAIDRIHRIGQVKPVKVHRIVIAETVEDRILALQEKKRDIIEGALAEDASKAIARLSARDLLFLFGIGG